MPKSVFCSRIYCCRESFWITTHCLDCKCSDKHFSQCECLYDDTISQSLSWALRWSVIGHAKNYFFCVFTAVSEYVYKTASVVSLCLGGYGWPEDASEEMDFVSESSSGLFPSWTQPAPHCPGCLPAEAWRLEGECLLRCLHPTVVSQLIVYTLGIDCTELSWHRFVRHCQDTYGSC